VVKCREQEKNRHHYESGLEFKKLDKNERERIVKYIFQEERSKRQNQKK
jgi:c-di-GMP-binding flagellar brake protein YcgR